MENAPSSIVALFIITVEAIERLSVGNSSSLEQSIKKGLFSSGEQIAKALFPYK